MKNQSNTSAQPTVDGAFLAVIQQHRRGGAMTDLSEELRKVNEAVQLTGRPGSVVLKLTVKPATQIGGAVVVEDEVTSKLPKTDRAGSIFFVDEDNNLRREDPKQMTMPLSAIPGGAAESKQQPELKESAS